MWEGQERNEDFFLKFGGPSYFLCQLGALATSVS